MKDVWCNCLSAGHCGGLKPASDVRWQPPKCRGRGKYLLPRVGGRPLQPELCGPSSSSLRLLLLLPLTVLLQLLLVTVAVLLQLLRVQWHEQWGPESGLHNQHQHHGHRESGLLINQLVMSGHWREQLIENISRGAEMLKIVQSFFFSDFRFTREPLLQRPSDITRAWAESPGDFLYWPQHPGAWGGCPWGGRG